MQRVVGPVTVFVFLMVVTMLPLKPQDKGPRELSSQVHKCETGNRYQISIKRQSVEALGWAKT
jgi:hypothetical protein